MAEESAARGRGPFADNLDRRAAAGLIDRGVVRRIDSIACKRRPEADDAGAGNRTRLAGWDAVDAENLHRFAAATTAYAADNGDRYWTFSWKKEKGYLDDPRAAAAQALDILRRKADRDDIQPIAWIPYMLYSALPLYDYLDQEMPALWSVCPADRHRMAWARDPGAFDQGEFMPCQPQPSNSAKR